MAKPKLIIKKSEAVKTQEVMKQVPKTKSTTKPVSPKTKPAMPKSKGLNDFLKEGKTPPSKNKKGIPSDADVIIKGYNDKQKQPIPKKVTQKIFKDSKKKAKDSVAKKKADEMFPKYMRSK